MKQIKDLTGQEFGYLTALEPTSMRYRKQVCWVCKCRCGNKIIVASGKLTAGSKLSCGCRPPDRSIDASSLIGIKKGKLTVVGTIDNTQQLLCKCECGNMKKIWKSVFLSGRIKSCGCSKDNRTKTRLYREYHGMIARCYNENCARFKNYGGRGIKVCEEWRESYAAFAEWASANGYDPSLPGKLNSLDRINVNGDYCPENCRWIPMAEQMRNCQNTVYLTFDGEKHTVLEWASITGIPYTTIMQRRDRGWSVEKMLTEPSNQFGRQYIDSHGQPYTIKQMAQISGCKYNVVHGRLMRYGWSVDECLLGHRLPKSDGQMLA